MISAFGIDHGEFTKSYIPGKGYVAATDLGRAGKKALRQHVEYSTRYRGNAGSKFQEAARYRKAKGRKLWEGFRTDFQQKVNVSAKPNQLLRDEPNLAGYARANGRGGGTIKVNPAHTPEERALTVKHEMAHITPKRNIWRLHQRTNDPIRMGGEEGRADFIAHGGPSKGAYPGNIAFQRGYNKVQRKMAAAQKRKQV